MSTVSVSFTETVTKTVASASATSTLRATPQGGVLEGGDPSHYDPKNPIILFIIQIRQPRVIAEVVGGILLGPSVMGRIPGFTDAIFPAASIPNLNLVANLGLVLFLFLVGLEVDLRYAASNWKVALSVGTAGMALPFGLGYAIAWGMYHQFGSEPGTVPISFATFGLFIGVAMAITAFPVLCRILTELKLLSTPVGIIVLSAGVANDVIGWVLLALCVALVNAGSGLTALWIVLVCVGYALFLVFAVRPAFLWVLRRTHALSDGPSQSVMALTIMIALTSAFFTGVIGVHPIFGAFMAGLICPHDGGFAIKVTEKVEDLISTLFLPLYFALSGLSTNLGLLDTGITWGYVVAVIAIAFCAKFAGGTLAAKANGLVWQEAATIGVLMSCKGLVELIVLNIGLQAKILSTRTFTIMVVMALITTFATTPLTAWLYPPAVQKKLELWRRGELDWATGAPTHDAVSEVDTLAREKLESAKIKSLLLYLRLDSMPTLLSFVSLLGNKSPSVTERRHPTLQHEATGRAVSNVASEQSRSLDVHAVRLTGLTDRGSTVMKVSEVDEYSLFDPVLNAFRVLGQIYNFAVSGEVAVVPENSFAETLVSKAESTDLLLLPWSETGGMSEAQTISSDSVLNRFSNDSYSTFILNALDQAPCNTAVFINNGFSGSLKTRPSTLHHTISGHSVRSQSHRDIATLPVTDRSHHIFMPFLGGADGRVALRLVLQLLENPDVTATIVHFSNHTHSEGSGSDDGMIQSVTQHTKSDRSNISRNPREDDSTFFATMQRSLPPSIQSRVLFETVLSSDLAASLDATLARAQLEVAQNPKNGGDLIVTGRNLCLQTGNECLGAVAHRFVAGGFRASLVVVQASMWHSGAPVVALITHISRDSSSQPDQHMQPIVLHMRLHYNMTFPRRFPRPSRCSPYLSSFYSLTEIKVAGALLMLHDLCIDYASTEQTTAIPHRVTTQSSSPHIANAINVVSCSLLTSPRYPTLPPPTLANAAGVCVRCPPREC
nr:k(+)/h(+) antiporter 1 [Quercus suber]